MQNAYSREWILPAEKWEEGLWPGIRCGEENSLCAYITRNRIQKHSGSHNLKSSWILCANLYFPFKHALGLLTGFLQERVSADIRDVFDLHLEYEHPTLKPADLLGEPATGLRGSGQTSPDLALDIITKSGKKGLILVENKYTEHSFYSCSGRSKKNQSRDSQKKEFFDPKRWLEFSKIRDDLKRECWQMNWEDSDRKNRKYWSYLTLSKEAVNNLEYCPAATAGYQLFRQQALAEALAKNGDFEFVASCVAYDERNCALKKCLKTTGINTIKDWGHLFTGQTKFITWTHQQWVEWVRKHDHNGKWSEWSNYIEQRYEI